jgi:hypothetical protein
MADRTLRPKSKPRRADDRTWPSLLVAAFAVVVWTAFDRMEIPLAGWSGALPDGVTAGDVAFHIMLALVHSALVWSVLWCAVLKFSRRRVGLAYLAILLALGVVTASLSTLITAVLR